VFGDRELKIKRASLRGTIREILEKSWWRKKYIPAILCVGRVSDSSGYRPCG